MLLLTHSFSILIPGTPHIVFCMSLIFTPDELNYGCCPSNVGGATGSELANTSLAYYAMCALSNVTQQEELPSSCWRLNKFRYLIRDLFCLISRHYAMYKIKWQFDLNKWMIDTFDLNDDVIWNLAHRLRTSIKSNDRMVRHLILTFLKGQDCAIDSLNQECPKSSPWSY